MIAAPQTLTVAIDGQRYRLMRRGYSVWAMACQSRDVCYRWGAGKWAMEGSDPLAFVEDGVLLAGLEAGYRELGGT